MSMNDPISDLLTRVRNAVRAKHDRVEVPASRLKEQVCAVLEREGFIDSYKRVDDGKHGSLQIKLKYTQAGDPVIQGLRRVSKPSLRVTKRSQDIRQVRSGLGIAILTTSQGVVTSKEARTKNVGGEVLCEVW